MPSSQMLGMTSATRPIHTEDSAMSKSFRSYHQNLALAKDKLHKISEYLSDGNDIESDKVTWNDAASMARVNACLDEILLTIITNYNLNK